MVWRWDADPYDPDDNERMWCLGIATELTIGNHQMPEIQVITDQWYVNRK